MGVGLALSATLVIAACGSSGAGSGHPSTPSASASLDGAHSDAPTEPALPAVAEAGTLPGAAEFLKTLGVPAGIAIAPLGGGKVVSVGSFKTGVSRSAMKVPIALAVQDNVGPTAELSDMQAAITASDNDAGQRIFNSLGSAAVANAEVEAELARYGDPNTKLPANGYYTEARWSLVDNARFAAGISCLNSPVTKFMGEVIPEQSFGLGEIAGAHYKGGWGDSSEPFGGSIVRQYGFITAPNGGKLGVAIGLFDAGEGAGWAILDKIGKWLKTAELPAGGHCSTISR